MPYCRTCGTKVPEDAVFCPNCGAPAEARTEPRPDIRENAQKYLFIGLIGAFLSVMINTFSMINLYFVPSFLSSIFVIYIYRVNRLKDSLVSVFAVYLFADGIIGTLILGQYYVLNTSITITPEILDVILYPFSPISAFISAYLGVKISPKRTEESMSSHYKTEEGPGGVIYYV